MSNTFCPIPRSTPAAEGVSAMRIAAFERALDGGAFAPRGYLLLRNGKVIAERFWAPYTPANKVWVYSLSKSFTATAIGIAADEGLLSVEDRVIDFFPDKAPAEPDENLREMRIHHLLSMNTGHDKEPAPPFAEALQCDLIAYFLNAPVTHSPGTHFLYNSMASLMLSAILQTVSGQPILEYLRPRLLEPLGFDETLWDFVPPSGINTGGWGLMVRPEDVAKLGQLYLNDGVWNGRRILSSDWVAAATAIQSDNDRPGEPVDWCQGYGYQFWRCQHGAFRGDGAFGQYCVVMPQQDMVLALMGETASMQPILDSVWEHLLPAVYGDSPAAQINGVRFSAQPQNAAANALGVGSLQFDFNADSELRVSFGWQDKQTELVCGRGCWAQGAVDSAVGGATLWKTSMIPFIGLSARRIPTAAWYAWESDDTLHLQWAYLETPHRASAEFHFDTVQKRMTLERLTASFAPQDSVGGIVFAAE